MKVEVKKIDIATSVYCACRHYKYLRSLARMNRTSDPAPEPVEIASSHSDDDSYDRLMDERQMILRKYNVGPCYDKGRGRFRGKVMTIRSWRDLGKLGGSCSRKAVRRKIDQRLPVIKFPVFMPPQWG